MRPDTRTIDMTERQHLCIGLDVRVFEHTMCADAGSMLELHCSFEDAIDVDADIRLAVQLAADIDARWIGERDAALEEAGSLLPLINALELGELRFAVHAQNLEQLGGLRSTNRRPVGDRERHYVGQVELALRVVIADFGQPPRELGSRRSENSGVDFRNTFLRGGCVALLDDAAHFTALSYDASVAGWIWRRGSNQQQCVLAVQHALQRRRSDEWNVAVEHQRVLRAQMRHGLLGGVRGTELRLLLDEDQVVLSQRLPNLFPTVSIDDDDALWPQAAGRAHDVTQQRAAGKRVQNFGLRGKHPRPLTGGQDDD